MIHVDPASHEFEELPRYQKARIYAAMNWDVEAIADELGIEHQTVTRMLVPGVYEKMLENARRWRQKPENKDRKSKAERRCRQKKEGARRRARHAALHNTSLGGAQMNLRTLYEDEKLSLKQIHERTGLPPSRIRTQLLRAGVKLRTRAVGANLRAEARKRRKRK